jgi:hypothetical protein
VRIYIEQGGVWKDKHWRLLDDPRVSGTIAAIERELFIDGLVYRFDPCG